MAEKASWRSGYIVVFVLFAVLVVSYVDRVNVAVLIAHPVLSVSSKMMAPFQEVRECLGVHQVPSQPDCRKPEDPDYQQKV